MENMFCPNMKVPSRDYKAGWYRSFKGYPEVNDSVWGLLQTLRRKPKQLLLFFLEHVTDDAEYANFLTMEILTDTWERDER